MAIELFPENSSVTMGPRISFSYDLSQTETIPVEQRIYRSNSSSRNIDFDFCVLESFEIEFSSADELFFDGKILPAEMKKTIVHPKPPPPRPPPQSHKIIENSKSERPKKMRTKSSGSEQRQNSNSFWRFNRSSSFNCGSGYARTLCSFPILLRSNSTTGSEEKENHKEKLQRNSMMKQSLSNKSLSSSSYLKQPPLKKSSGSFGNCVRINPVLNVPSTNLFGFCSVFSGGKEKNKKK